MPLASPTPTFARKRSFPRGPLYYGLPLLLYRVLTLCVCVCVSSHFRVGALSGRLHAVRQRPVGLLERLLHITTCSEGLHQALQQRPAGAGRLRDVWLARGGGGVGWDEGKLECAQIQDRRA